MNSRKIWYISKYAINPEQRGPSRQFLFSKYFAQMGYNTILISSNSNGFKNLKFKGSFKLFESTNLKHFVLKGFPINLGFNLKRIYSWFLFEFRLLKLIKKLKITKGDVVIVSSLSILTFLSGIYLKKKHKLKLIVEVRDIWPLTLIEFKNLNKFNPIVYILSAIEKRAYQKADAIIGTMGNLAQHIKMVSPGNEKKFNYIPMGLDFSIMTENEITKNLERDDFVVGYAGTLGRANNIELILDSAVFLRTKKNIKFKILGDGVLKQYYINKYRTLKNVEFLPAVDKGKVGKFLAGCNILLNPWQDKELYRFGVSPNKWIDYMYAAKPIIIPFNGYQNIINEAQCGEFIETNNPELLAKTIIKYSEKPKQELIKIGQNGRDYLHKHLTYKILSKKYINIINNV